jgi:AcrR family transcriptional regulator
VKVGPGGIFSEVYATPEQALRVQRRRILDAIVAVVSERGFASTSVGEVSARACTSRRTFYKLFDSLEDCVLAVMDEGGWYAGVLVSRAFEQEESWLDGVRGALAALLELFDREPALARVLLVEWSAAGPRARERREANVAALTALIEDRWGLDDRPTHPFAGAGVMASLLGILQTELLADRGEPLLALLGPMMGLVTAPYLDQAGVKCEIERGESLARELLVARDESRQREHLTGVTEGQAAHGAAAVEGRPGRQGGVVDIPALLLDPRAHRARACLLYLLEQGERGFSPSNRALADALAVPHRTQISALLARLQREGLLIKRRSRAGGPNASSLTQHGLAVAHALASHDMSPMHRSERAS